MPVCAAARAGARGYGHGHRGRQRGGWPCRPPPRTIRRCAAWPLAAPRPHFFSFPRGKTLCGKFFCLPTKIFVAKLRAANLFVTTKFATKQFEGGEFNHVHSNLPPQSQPRSQTMPSPSHLSSHAPLTEPRSSLKQEQLRRSITPLTLSPSPLSHNAREGMIPHPPTHS